MALYKSRDSFSAFKVTPKSAPGSYLSAAPAGKAKRLSPAIRAAMRARVAAARVALEERCAAAYAARVANDDPTPEQMAEALQELCVLDNDPCGAFRWASRNGLSRTPTNLFLVADGDVHLVDILAFALVDGNAETADPWTGSVPRPQQLRNAYEILNDAHLDCMVGPPAPPARTWTDAANAQKNLPKPYTHNGVGGEILYIKFDIKKMVWRAAGCATIGYLPIEWDHILA